MLQLGAKKVSIRGFPNGYPRFVARISNDPHLPPPLRREQLYLVSGDERPDGFLGYVIVDPRNCQPPENVASITLSNEFSYLGDGDIARVDPGRAEVRILYRRSSRNNSLLLTERCNNLCLMCSQPPKNIDDSWLIEETVKVLGLVDQSTTHLTLTGGEPTSLGDGLIRILRAAKSYLPRTAIQVLTNGRLFSDQSVAQTYAGVEHPDLIAAIPIYSDVSTIHDYVVQADGAFDETVRGILNLKQCGQRVEIRVVIHKQTYERLPQLAEFLTRNLTFVDHVALMGLEMTGFTLANLDDLWIDPWDYQQQLLRATETLADARMNVSIYNHQLCVLDRRIWRHARKSISDWKNEYFEECGSCAVRQDCGGFFSSAHHRYSGHISPIPSLDSGAVTDYSRQLSANS